MSQDQDRPARTSSEVAPDGRIGVVHAQIRTAVGLYEAMGELQQAVASSL